MHPSARGRSIRARSGAAPTRSATHDVLAAHELCEQRRGGASALLDRGVERGEPRARRQARDRSPHAITDSCSGTRTDLGRMRDDLGREGLTVDEVVPSSLRRASADRHRIGCRAVNAARAVMPRFSAASTNRRSRSRAACTNRANRSRARRRDSRTVKVLEHLLVRGIIVHGHGRRGVVDRRSEQHGGCAELTNEADAKSSSLEGRQSGNASTRCSLHRSRYTRSSSSARTRGERTTIGLATVRSVPRSAA